MADNTLLDALASMRKFTVDNYPDLLKLRQGLERLGFQSFFSEKRVGVPYTIFATIKWQENGKEFFETSNGSSFIDAMTNAYNLLMLTFTSKTS